MKLDLGCGTKKFDIDYVGVDAMQVKGVDVVWDLRVTPWPWPDNSVERVFCSHFVEHLSGEERIPFFNELWRVLKPGAQAEIVTPDWSHASAYGDPTHKWPPMSYWYLIYLDKTWRDAQVSHIPYTCDFTHSYAYTPDPAIHQMPPEAQRHAVTYNINAARELRALLTKRG
jgi:SAM-dependent methyltransferase